MQVSKLPPRVDMVFESDIQHFWLSCPYNKKFLEMLAVNTIKREWHPEKRAYRCPSSEFNDVYELVEQAYGPWKDVPIWGYIGELVCGSDGVAWEI